MAKIWFMGLALLVSAGLWAAPAMAQSTDDDVGIRSAGGGEAAADTTLGKKGLVFTSDGFSLRITTRVQFRLTYQNEVANGSDGTNGRDFVNFRVRRAKTTFSGHIFQKEFTYKMTLGWTHAGGNIIEVVKFRWAIMQYINVTAGQDKLPWNWEEMTSSGHLQFVDRSYTNEVFNEDYAKGITLDGQIGEDTPWLKYWVGVYNGVLRGANDYRNADRGIRSDSFNNLTDAEMMINLRLETHPLGEVDHTMNDMRGEDEFDKVLFAIGLGFNWLLSGFDAAAAGVRGDTAAGTPASGRFRTNQDTVAVTLDGHFRWHGLSVDIAGFMRHTEFHNRGRNKFDPGSRAGIGNMTDYGFTFLVAYMIIPEMFNVGIRWSMVDADDFWQGGTTSRQFGVRADAQEIGLSVNYYIHGDNLKLTLDILMVSQQVPFGAGGAATVNGVYNTPPQRGSFGGNSENADHNDLWIVRLQLQWIF
jgi:hypothetical protein